MCTHIRMRMYTCTHAHMHTCTCTRQVHLCGWRLLIKLGYMMMLFYFIFLAVSLLLETEILFSSC